MPSPNRRDVLALGAAASVLTTSAKAAAPAVPMLNHIFTVRATLAPPLEQGTVAGKRKRFIGITGGTVSGPRLSGSVLAGGGDWQAINDDGITEVMARYSLKADDGTVIGITNPGIRVATPDVIARLAAGEDVDPSLYYFRTTPTFDVAKGKHDWLRRKVFVTRGVRRPDHVVIEFYEVG
jgi:Protein of unknown function (DUF3237)